MSPKIMLVKWIDSEASNSWTEVEKMSMDFHVIESIGHLVNESKDGIALAVSWDSENNSAVAIQYIPHVCIMELQEIELDE